MEWTIEDIKNHPAMELTLKQLKQAKKDIIEFNNRIASKGLDKKYYGIRVYFPEMLNTFISLKEQNEPKLF
jgi:hypothetical protein